MSQPNSNEVIDAFVFDNDSVSITLATPQCDQPGEFFSARMPPLAGTDDCGLIPSPQRINLPDFNTMEVMFDDGYDSDKQLGPFVDPNGAADTVSYFEEAVGERRTGPNDEENNQLQVTTGPDLQQLTFINLLNIQFCRRCQYLSSERS